MSTDDALSDIAASDEVVSDEELFAALMKLSKRERWKIGLSTTQLQRRTKLGSTRFSSPRAAPAPPVQRPEPPNCGLWLDKALPRTGWVCVVIEDTQLHQGAQCEFCQVAAMRRAFVMAHSTYAPGEMYSCRACALALLPVGGPPVRIMTTEAVRRQKNGPRRSVSARQRPKSEPRPTAARIEIERLNSEVRARRGAPSIEEAPDVDAPRALHILVKRSF